MHCTELLAFIAHQTVGKVQFGEGMAALESFDQHAASVHGNAAAGQSQGARFIPTRLKHAGDRLQLALFARLQVPIVDISGHYNYVQTDSAEQFVYSLNSY